VSSDGITRVVPLTIWRGCGVKGLLYKEALQRTRKKIRRRVQLSRGGHELRRAAADFESVSVPGELQRACQGLRQALFITKQ